MGMVSGETVLETGKSGERAGWNRLRRCGGISDDVYNVGRIHMLARCCVGHEIHACSVDRSITPGIRHPPSRSAGWRLCYNSSDTKQ